MTLAPTHFHGRQSPRLRGLALLIVLVLVAVALLLLLGHDTPQEENAAVLLAARGIDQAPARPESKARRRTRLVVDAFRFATALAGWPLSHRAVRARADEDRRKLPGDDLLLKASAHWTNAITIHAQPRDIWPWLVQMGCRRAGWYSYDGLDNGGIRSAGRIVPEFQHVEVGDLFAWTPDAEDGFFVEAIEPERALVIGGEAGSLFRVVWAFVLEPLDETHTRLITRAAAAYDRRAVGVRLQLVGHPMHFAMQRRELLNLRQRTESR